MGKRISEVFVLTSLLVFLNSCSKSSSGGGGGTPPPPSEATLVVTLNPAAGSTQPPAPQTDFPLTVTISSTMPPQGVTISVSAKKDDGSNTAPYYTSSISSTASTNNFTITNTPGGSIQCLTTVTVTSKTTATNTWTNTYHYSRKP